jgi:hypothetical protein
VPCNHFVLILYVMTYRCRLPVCSGMGLTTSLRSLTLSPKLLARFDSYMRHVGSNMTSKALPGDEFAPEDIFSVYLTIMQEKSLTVKLGADRDEPGACELSEANSARHKRRLLTSVRDKTRKRDALVYPRETFVPRRIRFLDELVHCWRDGDVQKGCLFALRLLQTAEGRKRLIPSYKKSWWVALHHKDSLTRYKLVIKEIVKMAPDAISLDERGTDANWQESVRRFRSKWDDEDEYHKKTTITRYLAKFRSQKG